MALVASNYNAIYKGNKPNRLLLVKKNGKSMGAVVELAQHPEGYWFVVGGGPKRGEYLASKELLWEASAGAPSRPGALDPGSTNSGAPFHGQSGTPGADISDTQQLDSIVPESVEIGNPSAPQPPAPGNRAGFASPAALVPIATTGAGAGAGAAIDKEDRRRGALVGAAVGAGAGFAGRFKQRTGALKMRGFLTGNVGTAYTKQKARSGVLTALRAFYTYINTLWIWAIEELNLGPHAYQACALTT